MSLLNWIMATFTAEERARGRFKTPLEAEIMDRLAERKATRIAYSKVQKGAR